MDVAPPDFEVYSKWEYDRDQIIQALEGDGLRYYRGGRVLPNGQAPDEPATTGATTAKPTSIQELLLILLTGLRRAMHPLTHRRKGSVPLSFETEYDVQDLLHALLRPWVRDIRPEEFTPSYAGSSTKMDFLLPEHLLVIELKFVRDRAHGSKIGDELIIDVNHYQRPPDCATLWCVVYDPGNLLPNADGLKRDLEGPRSTKNRRGPPPRAVARRQAAMHFFLVGPPRKKASPVRPDSLGRLPHNLGCAFPDVPLGEITVDNCFGCGVLNAAPDLRAGRHNRGAVARITVVMATSRS